MGRLAWVWLVACACTGAACLHSNELVCDDGRICPDGSKCDVANDRCLTPAAVAACTGHTDTEACMLGGAPGTCHAGGCDPFVCGDGVAAPTEECDGDDFHDRTCLFYGYYGKPGLVCDSCRILFKGASFCDGNGFCGDDIVNGQELCDGSTDRSCADIGFDAGALSCNGQCGLTVEACSHFGWNAEALGTLVALAVDGTGRFDQWAVGDHGTVQHFDGFWREDSPPGVDQPLLGVTTPAPGDVWVVAASLSGHPSAVLHRDPLGGWEMVTTAPAAEYVDIWAASPTTVFAATADDGVQAWDGDVWNPVGAFPAGAGDRPLGIRGSTTTDLWVPTLGGTLQHWDGSTWAPASPPDAAIHFLDANAPDDVWAIGSSVDLQTGVVAHWNGSTWQEWRALHETYQNIASSGPTDAWVAASDDTMMHYDGVGWMHTTPIGASPSGLAAISGLVSIDANEVVAVSTLNLAYRYLGQAFGRFPTLPQEAIPDPRLQNAIWGDSIANQFVVNALGEIDHYDGVAWTAVFTIPPVVANQAVRATWVWGSSGGDVWVTTGDGRVFHATDGANFADAGAPPGDLPLDVIWGTSASNVWALGSSGAFHFDGSTWTTEGPPTARVLSASGSGPDDLWEVTDEAGGTLRRFHAGTWAVVTGFPTDEPLRAVSAVTPGDTFVAAGHGHILHRQGDAWRIDVVPAKADLAFFTATGLDDVTVASAQDLFHFDGGGWSPLRAPIDFVPNTPSFVPINGLQASAGRLDILLLTSKVRSLIMTRPITCEANETGRCSDGVDNDCDGVIDNCVAH